MTIFIAHSKEDKKFRNFFDRAFAGTRVERICAEFEDTTEMPPWKSITKWISQSSALFLLLSSKVLESRYTQNWISFEIGVACGGGGYKDVWIFEQCSDPVDFPVPYVNHYMIVDIENKEDSRYVKEIVNFYRPADVIVPHQTPYPNPRPRGWEIECQTKTCGAKFEMHTKSKSFKCPSCRQNVRNISG